MKPADAFCDHLDKCHQCREHAFNMCVPGAKLLREAAKVLAVENRKRRWS